LKLFYRAGNQPVHQKIHVGRDETLLHHLFAVRHLIVGYAPAHDRLGDYGDVSRFYQKANIVINNKIRDRRNAYPYSKHNNKDIITAYQQCNAH
jgi:hypothetical protein